LQRFIAEEMQRVMEEVGGDLIDWGGCMLITLLLNALRPLRALRDLRVKTLVSVSSVISVVKPSEAA
jgi:hypothetical protein